MRFTKDYIFMADKKNYQFATLKKEIVKSLEERLQLIGITESVTLVDGFVNQPLNMQVTGNVVIGGPSIPMIVLVGNETGRVYFFALKAILKNLGENHG